MKIHMTQAELQIALAKHFNDHVFGDEVPEYTVSNITRDGSCDIGVHIELTLEEVSDE